MNQIWWNAAIINEATKSGGNSMVRNSLGDDLLSLGLMLIVSLAIFTVIASLFQFANRRGWLR